MFQSTLPKTQSLKIPLQLPSFTLSSSSILEKILVPSSSLPAANVQIPSPETSIPVLSLTYETTLDQNIYFPLPTSHITMPIPTATITQTSSLVSTINVTLPFIESVAEFEQDNVVPLRD